MFFSAISIVYFAYDGRNLQKCDRRFTVHSQKMDEQPRMEDIVLSINCLKFLNFFEQHISPGKMNVGSPFFK
jgi:hypothetical protein